MTSNDNTDPMKGRRDEDSIPAGCPDCRDSVHLRLQAGPRPHQLAGSNLLHLVWERGGARTCTGGTAPSE